MDSTAGDRQDESSSTPWDTMNPDEPAAVGVAAPVLTDDQGEVAVYRALDAADQPQAEEASQEVAATAEVTSVAVEQGAHEKTVSGAEEPIESSLPTSVTVVDAVASESPENQASLNEASDSLPRYSGGGFGRGPSDGNLSAPEPPPQPSPGVPGEGAENCVDVEASVDGPSSVLDPSISQFTAIVDEETLENVCQADEREDELDQVCEDPELEQEPVPMLTGASWTIPMLCAGIGLIACCIIIPQADSNRRLAYEKQMLQADLESVERQVAVNGEFLNRVVDDPALSERLAQRQLKRVRKGQRGLQLKEEQPEMSPFQITNVAPPPAPPPYKPVGGIVAGLCYDARTRLYLMGIALTMIAGGLVLGSGGRRPA